MICVSWLEHTSCTRTRTLPLVRCLVVNVIRVRVSNLLRWCPVRPFCFFAKWPLPFKNYVLWIKNGIVKEQSFSLEVIVAATKHTHTHSTLLLLLVEWPHRTSMECGTQNSTNCSSSCRQNDFIRRVIRVVPWKRNTNDFDDDEIGERVCFIMAQSTTETTTSTRKMESLVCVRARQMIKCNFVFAVAGAVCGHWLNWL